MRSEELRSDAMLDQETRTNRKRATMRLKSYFAGTVEAAIALAARELGENAMLVYSREASPEARYLGRYEVVFGLPEEPGATQQDQPATPTLPKNAPASPKLE